MDNNRLERIEDKLDSIAERITGVEVELAKQEWKIVRRLGIAMAGLLSLVWTVVNIFRQSNGH